MKNLLVLFIFTLILSNVVGSTPDNYLEQAAQAQCSQFSVNDCENAENKNLEIDGKTFNCIINPKNNLCSADIYLQTQPTEEPLTSFLLLTLILTIGVGILLFFLNLFYFKLNKKLLLTNKKTIIVTIIIGIIIFIVGVLFNVYSALQF